VDRKVFDGDRIDDLEVIVSSARIRRQIKSSANAQVRLSDKHFRYSSSSLRLDELVVTHLNSTGTLPVEYRLCATWDIPSESDAINSFLEETQQERTIAGSESRTFRLNATALWPINQAAKWDVLNSNAAVSRLSFVDFCERFTIELLLPTASLDFMQPGPLEAALLHQLSHHVGIGRYPNDDMRVEDAAAHAVFLAETSRSRGASLTPAAIAERLRLRIDYGRVAQAFPLDPNVVISRSSTRAALRENALDGALQIVTAPPGAGKSWELTQLADDLRKRGAIVARHYCYIDPSDDYSALRITTNSFFGNLIYEIVTESPDLKRASGIGFAADSLSLERLLNIERDDRKRPLVLIVDGLDHIARVRAHIDTVSPSQSDIIEQIAALNIPPTVSIVIGSQPGTHLDPLFAAWSGRLHTHVLDPWTSDDLIALACAHDVDKVLESQGLDEIEIGATLVRLAERAEGNPLYCRALSVDLVLGSQDGNIATPLSWLTSDEGLGRGLEAYYNHLYRGVVSDNPVVADVLAVLDFSVTPEQLKELVGPLVRGHVEPALRALQSVLVNASAQGGIQIFHESFRRFLQETMARGARAASDALAPVIDWLETRGLFSDALGFRFLIPALARVDRSAEVWKQIDPAFVQRAIYHGHALEPILNNLTIASEVARRSANWPMLVRTMELRRSALSAFESSQNDLREYLEGFAVVFGHNKLAERLLFDGRPTLARNLGLFACDLIDRLGGIPPWREYLALPEEASERDYDLFDSSAALGDSERLTLCIFRGRLRQSTGRKTLRGFYRHLIASGDGSKALFIRQLAGVAADVLGTEAIASIVCRIIDRHSTTISSHNRAALLLGVSESAKAHSLLELSSDLAIKAASLATDAITLMAALELRAPIIRPLPFEVDPAAVPIGVGPDRWGHEAGPIRQWVAEVRITAQLANGDKTVFENERRRVAGRGWYRSWLGFVMDMALIEAEHITPDTEIVTAFEGLERDAEPFVGEPRAMDISTIRKVIYESLERALQHVHTRQSLERILLIVTRVSENTLYTLDGEDSGAIPTGSLLRLLLGKLDSNESDDVFLEAIEEQVRRRRSMHYPTLAEFHAIVARARKRVGDDDGALLAWSQATNFMAAYGWRKDSTVYELLECFDQFAALDRERALPYASDLQDVVDAVVRHTDGKGTKSALNSWLQSMLVIAPKAVGFLFARSTADTHASLGWNSEAALRLIVAAFLGTADPKLLDYLLLSIPLTESTSGLSADAVEARVAPLRELARVDQEVAAAQARATFASLCDDISIGDDVRSAAYELIRHEGVALVESTSHRRNSIESRSEPSSQPSNATAEPKQPQKSLPKLHGSTLAEIYRELRSAAREERYDSDRDELWTPLIDSLTARIIEMVSRQEVTSIEDILVFFARDSGAQRLSSSPHPIALLAERLEANGLNRLAAIAYVLAYTSTRSKWFGPFAGREYGDFIRRAIGLDRGATQSIYFEQVSVTLSRDHYIHELTADVLGRLAEWSDVDVVERSWREVFAQLTNRTPGVKLRGRFERLSQDDLAADLSSDEVIICILLARTSDARVHYKLEALRGLVDAMRRRPELLIKPLRWWLTEDLPRTVLVLLLSALTIAEVEPYEITAGVSNELRKLAASSFIASNFATLLLKRSGFDCAEPSRDVSEIVPIEVDGNWGHLEAAGGWAALRLIKKQLNRSLDDVERLAYSSLPDKHVLRDRLELMFGFHLDAQPPTPAILCETEELFRTIDDDLRRRGADAAERADTSLLEGALNPDLWFYLGRASSRSPRPPWPRPMVAARGVSSLLQLVEDGDPKYCGWTRIGLIESEYPLPAAAHGHEQPLQEITRRSGVFAWPSELDIPSEMQPFTDNVMGLAEFGPLVFITREAHWLGYPWRLEAPLSLILEGPLRPSQIGEPIAWSSDDRAIQVAMRSWRVIRSDPTAEPASFIGCDLLASPRAISRLIELHGQLRELTIVIRSDLHRPFPKAR
jgi:hypothetical protein